MDQLNEYIFHPQSWDEMGTTRTAKLMGQRQNGMVSTGIANNIYGLSTKKHLESTQLHVIP